MHASKYNTDASFTHQNHNRALCNSLKNLKTIKDHTLVPNPGHKPSDPDHSSNTFRRNFLWPHSSLSLNRFLPGVTGEFRKLKNNIFKAQKIPHKSIKIMAQNNASQFHKITIHQNVSQSDTHAVIIIIMSCRQHGYPWPSLATSPYHSSLLAGLQGYIPYPHIAAVCMLELVVLLLLGHMRCSIGVHHWWVRPCFSGSVLHVWFV